MVQDKNKIIDETINMLNIARDFPAFIIFFKMEVDNEKFEKHAIETAIEWESKGGDDWIHNGPKILTEDEIQEISKKEIEKFRKTKGYNKDGCSIVIYSKHVTRDKIGYDYIKKIMEYEEDWGHFKEFDVDLMLDKDYPHLLLKYLGSEEE